MEEEKKDDASMEGIKGWVIGLVPRIQQLQGLLKEVLSCDE